MATTLCTSSGLSTYQPVRPGVIGSRTPCRFDTTQGTPDAIRNNEQVAMVLLGASGPDAFAGKG